MKIKSMLTVVGAIICSLLLLTTNMLMFTLSAQESDVNDNTFELTKSNTILYVGGSGIGNYTSIQQAVDNASDGDIVFVYNGVYYENVVIEKSISLIGEQQETTIIDGGNTSSVVTMSSVMMNMSNFTIQHGGNHGVFIDNAHGATLSHLRIRQNVNYGIYAATAINCTIKNNYIFDNTHGIYLDFSSRYCSIRDNQISNNSFLGLSLKNSFANKIQDNLISGNSYGLKLYSTYDCSIFSNQLMNNSEYSILLKENSHDNEIRFNNIYFTKKGIEIIDDSSFNLISANTIKTSMNTPPTAIADSKSTIENSSVLISVLDNDYDRDGWINSSSIIIEQPPTYGIINVNTTGEIEYIPNTGYVGNDSFTYRLTDDQGLFSNNAMVKIKIIPDTLGEEISQQQAVLNRSLPIYGDWWMAQSIRPQAGTLTKIGLRLKTTGNPPAPLQVDIHQETIDGPIVFSSTCTPSQINSTYDWILFDDTDFIVDPTLQYFIVAHSTSGNPNHNYEWGHSNNNKYQAGNVFTSTDFGSNWEPLNNSDFCFRIYKTIGIYPVSANDTFSTTKGKTLTISAPGVLVNDFDYDQSPSPLSSILVDDVSHGSLTLQSDGSFTYIPHWDFSGTDEFTYKATDGKYNSSISTVTLHVSTEDTYCVHIPFSGSDSTDNILIHNNFYSSTPNPITYDYYDNKWDNTTLLSTGGNYWSNYNEIGEGALDDDANGFYDDPFLILENSQDNYPLSQPYLSFLPTANFSWMPVGPDTSLQIQFTDLSTDYSYGSIVEWFWQFDDGNTSNDQHPLHQYDTIGVYNVSLTISDDDGLTDTINKWITISASPPTADFSWIPDNPETFQNVNFTDLSEDDGTIVSWLWDFDDGTTSTMQNPTHQFNDNGVYNVALQVGDDDGATDTITKQIMVANQPPNANNDTVNTFENTSVIIDVLNNDSDVDGYIIPSSVTVIDSAQHGTTMVNSSTGKIEYMPTSGFYGSDDFIYQISDDDADTDTAMVTVEVIHINLAPIAENDSYNATEDQELIITAPGVLSNDFDSDAYPSDLSSHLISGPSNGSLLLNTTGAFIYTPDPDFYGVDSFVYQAFDGMNYSSNTTVIINVSNINDAPIAIDDSYEMLEDTVFQNFSVSVLDNDIDSDNQSTDLTATLVDSVSYGNLTFYENGSFVYTPNPDFYGVDTFLYQAFDGLNYSEVATVTLNVENVNDAPVAYNDSYSTSENTLLTVNEPGVLENDIDIDSPDLSAVQLLGPYHGSLTFYDDGSFEYLPNTGFYGYDSFSYQAYDGNLGSNIANVTIYVNDSNEHPIAFDDSYLGMEDSWLNVSAPGVLANDSDPDNGPQSLTTSLKTKASHGTLSLNADGSFSYLPNENYTGSDSFSYYAFDGINYSNEATVTLSIENINDAPVANDNLYNTDEDINLTVQAPGVLSNDFDAESQVADLTAVLQTTVSHGILSFSSNGSFEYVPNPNYFGVDTFTYQAYDGINYSNNATVTIVINSVNDHPIASNDSYVMSSNTTLYIPSPGVLNNDYDPDNYPNNLTAVIANHTVKGVINLSENGSFIYTPLEGFSGNDSFTYFAFDGMNYSTETHVNITIIDSNIPPVAVNDTYYEEKNSNLSINSPGVLSNDYDPDTSLDNLSVILISDVSNGSLLLHANGSFSYAPQLNFTGIDSFVYQVFDGENYSNNATVTITIVDQINPIAHNDSYYLLENDVLSVFAPGVLSNDTGGVDNLSTILVSDVSYGSLSLNENGSFTYQPTTGWSGIDMFTYQATDGYTVSNNATVTITVLASNQAPIANDDIFDAFQNTELIVTDPGILSNDYDPDLGPLPISPIVETNVSHGQLLVSDNGSFTYNPDENFTGTDQFTYYAFDGLNYSNLATVTITVSSTNQAPIAQPDYYSIDEDIILFVNTSSGVLSNDIDPDNGPQSLSAVIVDSPSFGFLTFNSSGSFMYQPNENFSGTDLFTYQAYDGQSYSNLTNVTITINPVNDAPVAIDDEASMIINSSITINISSNDIDADDNLDLSSISITQEPTNGTRTINGDGTITYTPNPGFTGVEILKYTISDTLGLVSNEATIRINVTFLLDVNQSMFDRGFPIRSAADGAWAGAQSFNPNLNLITTVSLYVRTFGSASFNLTVELREDAVNGTLLDTHLFTPSDIPSSWSWITIDVTDIIVDHNTTYFIVIQPAPGSVTNSFGYEWGYAFGDQYDDGSFWFTRDGGNLWRDLPSMYEFTFRTYGLS